MNGQPPYFEPIRQQAALRWDQLERDPDLAGPWHQLFKQVQSPRHILSELLQNADDAGATEAAVRIENSAFIFEHNGEDFKEDHFASLCRFGYSNKRVLHTIGFRGIGFKSTFSLGDAVELHTPSLSVVFHSKRFTEPSWVDTAATLKGVTMVRVAISDDNRRREVEKNLEEWLKSPVSLLFFKNIRRLCIETHDLRWSSLGAGPVPDSERMVLNGNEEESFLLISSDEKEFPQEAVFEICQERMIDTDQSAGFPPSKVEIALGAKGRLYVVLPTGVETTLPFACNAPFIQDPARLKIKDPETSPTNRWLLGRIGKLAASAMIAWLKTASLSLADRSYAYALMPDVDREDSSLEGVCATVVEESFAAAINEKSYVLTQEGELTRNGMSVVIPDELFEIWPEDKVASYFDAKGRPALSKHIAMPDRVKLTNWSAVESINRNQILSTLETNSLPKPEGWRQLLALWVFVAPDMVRLFRENPIAKKLHIVPVQGKDILYSAHEVVRLGEKRLLQSYDDWDFLATNLLVLNQNWPRFLAEQRRDTENGQNNCRQMDAELAQRLLSALGLEDASDVSKVIDQVASSFFVNEKLQIKECVRLAQIACKLGASVGDAFRYVTLDSYLRQISFVVVYDPKGERGLLLPKEWYLTHTLNEAYANTWNSCTPEEWARWIESGRAGFASFVPISLRKESFYDRTRLLHDMDKRGFSGTSDFPYRNEYFQLEDWDFTEILWSHWQTISLEDENIWGQVMQQILYQPVEYWSKAKSARASQIATTGTKRSITNDQLLPNWIIKFRELPCLPDTRGFYRKPSELLRRTPETESLMDVEPFLHGRIDNEATRPFLDLLGVSNVPTGPERLLDCLRALSKSDKPPVQEVEKWYRRLDQMADSCSTESFSNIKKALRDEKIVLTEDSVWTNGSDVFLSSDEEDVPGAAVIRQTVADLSLWRKIAISERPTADLAILWMKSLPIDCALPSEELRRVKALLARHATRIWYECGCWLSLANELVAIDTLRFSLTMRTLIPWSSLHPWVKQATADFQKLSSDLTDFQPFSDIPSLASRIDDHFELDKIVPGQSEQKPWVQQFGTDIARIQLEDKDDEERIRKLGSDLAESCWQQVSELEVIPYIDGKPAGTSKDVDVIWSKNIIYFNTIPYARLARLVPEMLGKVFDRPDVSAALSYCYGRSPVDVTEYMKENFSLADPSFTNTEGDHHPTETNKEIEHISDRGIIPSKQQNPELIENMTEIPREAIADISTKEVPDLTLENVTDDQELVEVADQKPRINQKSARASIVELFIQNLGYRKEGDDYFIHADGSSLVKSRGEIFPWVRSTSSGEVICRYWTKDHCLEREPMEIDAEIWSMVEKFPQTCTLLLADTKGNPIEIRGETLNALRDSGNLKLYPATYRLVYKNEHE